MPNHETHVQSCVDKFGIENADLCAKVREWIDDPQKRLEYRHRIYLHDIVETPKEAERRFGSLASEMAVHHILKDYSQTWREPDLEKVEHRLRDTSKNESRIKKEALSTYTKLLNEELRGNRFERNSNL